MSYIAEIASTVVGHGVMFEISPNALDRVHVGCVRRQVVDRDLPTLGLDMRLHELRAGGLQAIPDDEQLLAKRGLQGFEELDDLRKTPSRPHVSDDNPYSEAQFKTLKYRPDFPARFGSIEDARSHCQEFFHWYNGTHCHSGIGFM